MNCEDSEGSNSLRPAPCALHGVPAGGYERGLPVETGKAQSQENAKITRRLPPRVPAHFRDAVLGGVAWDSKRAS